MAINKLTVLETGLPEDSALIGAFLLCDYVGTFDKIRFAIFELIILNNITS